MQNKSILVSILSWLLGIVVTIVATVAGAYIIIKSKYNVDIFKAINQVRALAQPVDEESTLTNKFSDVSMTSVVTKINASLPTLLVLNGENKYVIDSTQVSVTDMQENVRLTDAECGALLNNLFIADAFEANPIKIGNAVLPMEFVELDFGYHSGNNAIKFTVVIKLDATLIKNNMTSFPATLLKDQIPNHFYLFATTVVTKTENAFEYTLADAYMKANNLSVDDTMSLFGALNKFLNFGEPSAFAGQFVNTIANALFSNEDSKGFMYVMEAYNATDFNFAIEGETIYVEILRP